MENTTDAARNAELRLLYDRKSAAKQLSISVRTLDSYIASKQLQTRRVGKRVLIPRGELVRFARGDRFLPRRDEHGRLAA